MARTLKQVLQARVKSITFYNGRANVTVEPEGLFLALEADATGAEIVNGERRVYVDQGGLNGIVTKTTTAFEDAEFDRASKQVSKQRR